MANTYDEALAELPAGSVWSCSFGNPGEGGYVAYYRHPDGSQWIVSNGPYHLQPFEFDWHCQREERPAGYAAVTVVRGTTLLYAFGETRDEMRTNLRRQIIGASASMSNRIMAQIEVRPVDADEASEIMEMLDADVIAWTDVERGA